MPEPADEEDFIGAGQYANRPLDIELVRDAENRACFDLLCERENPDQVVAVVIEVILTGTAECRCGYLWAICRAAYAGSRH